MIATRYERSSAVAFLGWAVQAPPYPDGELEAVDRQHAAHQYVSLSASGFPALPVDWIHTVLAPERSLRVSAHERERTLLAPERALMVVAEPVA